MLTSPNFRRPGVIGGFVLGLVAGLTPELSIGALFAQGVLWQPGAAPVVPAAPAAQFSYLGYNSSTGLYWTVNTDGDTADDAVLGWVETNATDLIAVSNQQILIPAGDEGSSGGSGGGSGVLAVGGSPFGTGGGSSFGGMETMVPDAGWNLTPDLAAGYGHYYETTTNDVTVQAPVNLAAGMCFCVVILQGATGRNVAFAADYKGLSEFTVDTRANSYASLFFQVQADLSCLLLLVGGNGVLRA